MKIKNNLQLIISVLVMCLGVIMLLGTSYSLITRTSFSDDTYGLSVGDLKVEFSEKNNIVLENSVPISDEEALSKGKEFIFKVKNTGDYTANYTLKIVTEDNSLNDVIRYSYSLNNSNYSVPFNLLDNPVISQNTVLASQKEDVYKLKLWMDINADASYMGKAFSGKISLSSTQNDYKYASNVLEKLATEEKDNVLKIDNNYYYTGEDTNNYVWFNCDDGYTKGDTHCEKWRIIGSIDNTWENGIATYKSLKIIRNDFIESKYSYNNALDYLNKDYYNSLTLNAKEMILKAKWDSSFWNLEEKKSSEDSFEYRDIGLISTNDFINISKEKKWLKTDSTYWLFNPMNDEKAFVYNSELDVLEGQNKDIEYNIRPVVYLKPDVSIIDGFGTMDSPYEISIKFPMSYNDVK